MEPVQYQSFSKWSDFPIWLRVVAVIALVNFAAFWLIAASCGGDAWNGYIKDGRYLLGSHGTYTEVSRAFWKYSYYHVLLTWITHGTVFVGFAIFLNTKQINKKKNGTTNGST
jgi:hypothetical protein